VLVPECLALVMARGPAQRTKRTPWSTGRAGAGRL